MAILGFGSKV
uniref:Uncharacterized protein n=1 Tax=Rhizophora mucronata TaxID=61149 RepID=A0A2P2QR69_RHIMU